MGFSCENWKFNFVLLVYNISLYHGIIELYYYTNDSELLSICSIVGLQYSKFGIFVEKLNQIYHTVDYLCDEHDIIIFNLSK